MKKNTRRLLSALMALCMAAAFSTSVFAAEAVSEQETSEDRIEIDNVDVGVDFTHMDVKVDSKYTVIVAGEEVELTGALDPNTIKVVVKGQATNINYSFADYEVTERQEKDILEYSIGLSAYDAPLLAAIAWDYETLGMHNVYVNAQIIFAEMPEALQDIFPQNEDGNWYVDVVDHKYTGIQ